MIPIICILGILVGIYLLCYYGIYYGINKYKYMNVKRKIDLLLAKSNGAQLLWLLILSALCLSLALFVSYYVFGDGKVPWQDVVAIFLDPGCFGGPGEHDFFRLSLALLSVFLFSALLVSVFTNLFENIREAAQSGNRRYRLRDPVIILGYCPQVPAMLAAIRARNRLSPIVIVDEEKPELEGDFIFYKAARDSMADLRGIVARYAEEIYVMGDPEDPAHDEKNLRAMEILRKLCVYAPRDIYCYVTLADYTTTEVIQYSRQKPVESRLLVDTVNVYEYEAEQLLLGFLNPFNEDEQKNKEEQENKVEQEKRAPFLPVLHSGDKRRLHLLIIGTGRMAQAVAYTAAHLCHYPNFAECGARTLITFVGEDMRGWQRHLQASRPALFAMSHQTFVSADGTTETTPLSGRDILDVEWQFVDAAASSPLVREMMLPDADTVLRVVVCHAETQRNIATALHLPRQVYETSPVAVYAPQGSAVLEQAKETGMYGDLVRFGQGGEEMLDPLFVRRAERGKRVNLVYHRAYVDGNCWNEELAWRGISEADKYSSIYCGNAMLLRRDCIALPTNPLPFLLPEEYRQGMEMEHRRWMMSELLMGFAPAPVTNKARFEHADLVPFDELPSEEQGKDWILMKEWSYIIEGRTNGNDGV